MTLLTTKKCFWALARSEPFYTTVPSV